MAEETLKTTKVCPYPFSRMELGNKSFTPCCGMWLKEEFHQLDQGEDFWNGPAAQELRQRMYNGDYSLCRRSMCKTQLVAIEDLDQPNHTRTETSVTKKNLEAIQAGETVLPEGPSSISTIADPRCNLACPSCRSDFIFNIDDYTQKKIDQSQEFIWKNREHLVELRMSGNGEVFFSPWLRGLFKLLSKQDFPKLKRINVQTNGILMSPEEVGKLRPGTDLIYEVMVSIDAGNEEVYKSVRKGGDWQKLMRNLEWISQQRKVGRFKRLKLQFVVRRENYKTIPEFINLGLRLGVDCIFFTALMPWENMAIADYRSEAVHVPSHPEHEDFLAYYNQAKQLSNKRVVIFEL